MSEEKPNIKKSEQPWQIINKSCSERPLVQQYDGYEELPPIPISFPQKGAIGKTGDWRTYKPVIDREKCTRCGQCYIYCPEGTIEYDDQLNEYTVDLVYCKGCGICARHCPVKAIEMILEEK